MYKKTSLDRRLFPCPRTPGRPYDGENEPKITPLKGAAVGTEARVSAHGAFLRRLRQHDDERGLEPNPNRRSRLHREIRQPLQSRLASLITDAQPVAVTFVVSLSNPHAGAFT